MYFYQLAACEACSRLVLRLHTLCFLHLYVCASPLIMRAIIVTYIVAMQSYFS